MRPAPLRSSRHSLAFRRGSAVVALILLLAVVLVAGELGAHTRQASAINAKEAQAMLPTTSAAQANAGVLAGHAVGAPVAGAAAASGAAAVNQVSPLPGASSGQMLIRSGQIELEAKDPAALVDRVRQIASSASAGADAGYVADEQLQMKGSDYTATITISVPAPTFAAVMQALRGLGSRVLNETSSSQDVTAQYVDVDAQLQALRATQAQLLQLLGKTQQIADTLAVQRELSTVNSQINQLEGRENYLKAHSAFSTIVVTIQPPEAVAPTLTGAWNPWQALLRAIATLGAVAQGTFDAAIWLLVFGVPLAVLALVGVVLQRTIARAVHGRRGAPSSS